METLTHARVTRQLLEACWQCGTPTPSDGNADPHLCLGCRQFAAHVAFTDALATLQKLRKGEAPFDVLTPAERAEQIEQLIGLDDLADAMLVDVAGHAADEIGRRLGSVPEPRRVTVPTCCDGEPIWTWDGPLTDVDRDAMLDVEEMDMGDRFDGLS